MDLGRSYAMRVESLRELIGHYDREVATLASDIHAHLRSHRGYQGTRDGRLSTVYGQWRFAGGPLPRQFRPRDRRSALLFRLSARI